MLKAAIPSLTRVAILVNPNVPSSRRYIDESEAAAIELGLTVQRFEARTLDDIDRAFDAMVKARMQAQSINPEGAFFQYRHAIGESIASLRLPTCVFSRETMVGGALMSYGPDHGDLFRRAVALADKLLKGAKPSDLPVELPRKIAFVIDNKMATVWGIAIPPHLMLRADEVID